MGNLRNGDAWIPVACIGCGTMSDDDAARDVMDIVAARLREQGADEFWRRLYRRDEDTIEFAGRLTHTEIADYTRAIWYAREFKQDWLSDLVRECISLSASHRGKAREEAVRAMTGSAEQHIRTAMRLRKVQ